MSVQDIIEDLDSFARRESRVINKLDLILRQIQDLQGDLQDLQGDLKRARDELAGIQEEKSQFISQFEALPHAPRESTSTESRKRIKSRYLCLCLFGISA